MGFAQMGFGRMEISDLDMERADTSLVPDLRKCAILLDIDGTILDLAPSPQQVWVPTGLRQTLARLDALTGGALALVSGRSLHDIDLIFSPLELAAIGGHGAELRPLPNAEPMLRAKALNAVLRRQLAGIAELGPGILAEDKGYSLALHYRLAPEMGDAVRAAVDRICAMQPPDTVEILPGKLVVEIKPTGINKATAVCELMNYAPFAGPQSDLHRRRHHRRAGVRHHLAIWRLGLLRRPGGAERQRSFRQARIGSRMACAHCK